MNKNNLELIKTFFKEHPMYYYSPIEISRYIELSREEILETICEIKNDKYIFVNWISAKMINYNNIYETPISLKNEDFINSSEGMCRMCGKELEEVKIGWQYITQCNNCNVIIYIKSKSKEELKEQLYGGNINE